MLLRHLVSFTKLPWIPLLTSISSLQPVRSTSYICSTDLKTSILGGDSWHRFNEPTPKKKQGYTLGKPRPQVLSTMAMRQPPKLGSSSAHSSGTRTKSPTACSNPGDRGAGTDVIPSPGSGPRLVTTPWTCRRSWESNTAHKEVSWRERAGHLTQHRGGKNSEPRGKERKATTAYQTSSSNSPAIAHWLTLINTWCTDQHLYSVDVQSSGSTTPAFKMQACPHILVSTLIFFRFFFITLMDRN